MVCQKKKGCAALNHKSYSRLCQISSTLQAPKRNKETLLFGFPFSEDDLKLKRAQINLKMRTKCGVVPGCQAVAQGGTRERPRSPSASRSCSPPAESAKPVTAPHGSHRARPPVPRAQTELRRQEPRARRCPPERGRTSRSRPGSRPLIRGRPRGERSLRRWVQPAARPRDGEARRKGHLNPGRPAELARASPDAAATPGAPRPPARRSQEKRGSQVALKCISLPQMEGAGGEERGEEEKERRTSDRQGERGGRAQSAARPPFRPRPALSVRPALPPPPRTAPPQTTSAGARPSARAFVHIHPPKQASSPPGRAPRKKGGEPSGPGAPDTHPADPAEGRVLLIHFPLALARPGRQGAGRKWALRSGGLSGTVRAPGGVRARAGLRGCREGRGEEGAGAPPRD